MMISEPLPEGTSHPLGEAETAAEASSLLPFPVVGVGASAGGMEAFARLVEQVPADAGLAFLLVLHLDPRHESLATEILSRSTGLIVREAGDRMPVAHGHIYVIPPNTIMSLTADGCLEIRPRAAVRAPHMPIDYLFRSLAATQQGRAIGVILSGGGTDGTLGLREIAAQEGITFAQDELSARHTSMPRSAANSGHVDFILPPEEITRELLRIAAATRVHPPSAAEKLAVGDREAIQGILDRLLFASGVDFSQYKQTTILRRLRRRMALRNLNHVPDYRAYLESDAAELRALYQDLLIRVTSFFRDPAAFQALHDVVFPGLLEEPALDHGVRIWVTACATGEEVFSVAIALMEFLGERASQVPIKILATDVNEASLEKARAGVYLENIEMDVSAERLRRHFTKIDGHYQISKSIRDLCVFSRHNVVRDPPFSHINLITCRNLLIYLGSSLQKQIAPLFHYSLSSRGFLMLGNSETIGPFSDLFEMVDDKQRIYTKKTSLSMAVPALNMNWGALTLETLAPFHHLAGVDKGILMAPLDVQREADRLLLLHYAPAGVVIDENMNILQFRGHTSPYLEHGPGSASLNLLRMARDGLLIELRNTLREIKTSSAAVRKEGLLIKDGDRFRMVNLMVLPIRGATSIGSRCYLIVFEEVRPPASLDPSSAAPAPLPLIVDRETSEDLVTQLQLELENTREYLQSVNEEHEATTEELKSANEEILSSNEELQSTNEELQSAKEELQSTNEELATVNEELQHRNQELSKLNDDLINLFGGVNLPIVLVSRDLRVRRITPMAEQVFNLIPSDVGRSIADIRSNLNLPDLDRIITDVIQTLAAREVEAQDSQGHWYSVRIRPYVTLDSKIGGASIVAVDIDPLKTSLDQARLLAQEQSARVDAESANRAKDEFVAMLAHELRNPLAPLTNALHLLRQPDGTAGAAGADGAQDMLAIAQRQVRFMSRMLDDLLDVARVNQKKLRIQKEPVELAALLARVLENSRPLIEADKHHLEVHQPPGPVWFTADPIRLIQVLTNLLNNAVKYTPAGGCITLSAEQTGEDQLVLRVKDNGVGISPDMLPRVFDLFSQSERSLERSAGGLGIGLTLVKHLVELHDGSVQVFSKGPGQGSEFVVRLPMEPGVAPVLEPPQARSEAPARRVLIIDENRDAADSLAQLLRQAGHEVQTVAQGPAAVRIAQESRPELVLLDIRPPAAEGRALARQLRQLPELNQTLLVALAGYGQDEDHQPLQKAGIDLLLIKPVVPEQLQQILALPPRR